MRLLTPVILSLSCAFACSPSSPAFETEEVTERDGGLSATADGLKVFVHEDTRLEPRGDALVLVLKGSSNRNLDTVASARPGGGVLGQAAKLGPKSFELVFATPAQIDEVLRGAPVQLAVRTQTGAVRDFTAQLRLAPSYEKFTGASNLFVRAAIEPVYAGGFADRSRYRSKFSAPTHATDVTVTSQSNGAVAVVQDGPKDWIFDRTSAALLGELDKKTDRTTFKARVSQQTLTKKAGVGAKVVELLVTSGDPAQAFPAPTCDATVAACIEASLLSGDVSGCGDYLQVATCLDAPGTCLLGRTVEQTLQSEEFNNTSYQWIEQASGLPSELAAKVIAAAREIDSSVSTVNQALALGQVEHTAFQRVATGQSFDAVTVTASGRKFGAIFEADGSQVVATVHNSLLGQCTLVAAPGGGQIGEDCNDAAPCGVDLTCLGENPAVGFGKCTPEETPAGTGDACGNVAGPCASQELVCGGLTGLSTEGNCVPAWLRGQFDDWAVTPLVPEGTLEREIEAYGLATVAMDASVYVEVVNVVPSAIVVKLRNPSGTEATLWDGPAIAAAEPWIDGDNFIEISTTADSFPSDESANGTYTLVVESLPGNDPGGEVTDWHLTVTSRFD